MGRKPVLGLAGLLLASAATLTGCKNCNNGSCSTSPARQTTFGSRSTGTQTPATGAPYVNTSGQQTAGQDFAPRGQQSAGMQPGQMDTTGMQRPTGFQNNSFGPGNGGVPSTGGGTSGTGFGNPPTMSPTGGTGMTGGQRSSMAPTGSSMGGMNGDQYATALTPPQRPAELPSRGTGMTQQSNYDPSAVRQVSYTEAGIQPPPSPPSSSFANNSQVRQTCPQGYGAASAPPPPSGVQGMPQMPPLDTATRTGP